MTGSQSAYNAAAFSARDFDSEFPAHRHRARLIAGYVRRLGPFRLGADVGCFGGAAGESYTKAGIGELHGFGLAEG